MKKVIMIFLMVALVAMGIIGGGLYWAAKKNTRFENYKHTKGTFIEPNKKKLGDYPASPYYYYPRVIYYDAKGEPYTFEFKIGLERNPERIGEEIDLLFNPNHPDDVMVDSFLSKWLGPVIVCTIGFSILIIVIIVTAVRVLNERKQLKEIIVWKG